MLGLFPGTPSLPHQSDKVEQLTAFVTSSRPRNINLVPIGYGFRPHLRGRLTLRGLALHRNPWTYGERVSHPLYRYSCQHSHFRYLQRASRHAFAGLRNAPLPRQRTDNRGQMPDLRLPWPLIKAFQRLGNLVVFIFCPLTSVNCPLTPAASVRGLSPGTSSARDGLSRPVSCYAFFKGWLLLSQPPGCLGLPTSFPT